jgi:2-polyprenyl-3-methyl-5-hydroxy-6-metoxy-1,4-benzoquinol methylase
VVLPEDKSLSYYGWLYNKLFDPALLETRKVVAHLVADGSSVIDIGCGTGLLSFSLGEKRCRVWGGVAAERL